MPSVPSRLSDKWGAGYTPGTEDPPMAASAGGGTRGGTQWNTEKLSRTGTASSNAVGAGSAGRLDNPGYFAPGGDPENQLRSPEGWDFSQPGVAEQYFNENNQKYDGQGQADQWWGANQDKLSAPGQSEQFFGQALNDYSNRGPNSNDAAEAYNLFKSGSPQDMSPYYDNAARKLNEGLNTEFASRGAYGSSVGMDRIAEANTDLRAQQAKDEANYGLQRYGLGGQLGAGADASGRANSQGDLAWTTGLGGLSQGAQGAQQGRMNQAGQYALGVDSQNLQNLNSGMNAAQMAEEARRLRGRDYMGDMTGNYDRLSALGQHQYENMFNEDANLLDAQEGMQTGIGTTNLDLAGKREDRTRQDVGNVASLAAAFATGGGSAAAQGAARR